MGPDGLGFKHIERDVSDPAIEVVFFDIDDRFFVLGQRPDKEDEHSEEEHRASDFQGASVSEHGPDRIFEWSRRFARAGEQTILQGCSSHRDLLMSIGFRWIEQIQGAWIFGPMPIDYRR